MGSVVGHQLLVEASGRSAPARRITASVLGKTPTTSTRRLISLFNRSNGLVDLLSSG